MDHHGPHCAQLGHYIAQITVIWCQHHQAFTLVVTAGDDADDTLLDSRTVRFGPFDQEDDVAHRGTSELERCIRTTRRVWLDRRRPHE